MCTGFTDPISISDTAEQFWRQAMKEKQKISIQLKPFK